MLVVRLILLRRQGYLYTTDSIGIPYVVIAISALIWFLAVLCQFLIG